MTIANRAAWKKTTIMTAMPKYEFLRNRRECADDADQESSRRQGKRKSKIGERIEGQVFHVPQRELVGRRVIAQSLRDIARRRDVAHSNQDRNRGERRQSRR